MSTKEVQRDWNRAELKTGEGISKYNLVEYTLHGWCENFSDYLKSVMSYTNSLTLLEYRRKLSMLRYLRVHLIDLISSYLNLTQIYRELKVYYNQQHVNLLHTLQ
jgi:hypothetical protein